MGSPLPLVEWRMADERSLPPLPRPPNGMRQGGRSPEASLALRKSPSLPAAMPMRDKSWMQLLAEASAVVLSILTAFAIDAWWDARQLRQAESQAIVSLRTEFELNLRIADAAAEHHSRSIEAGEQLLRMARGDEAAAPGRYSIVL